MDVVIFVLAHLIKIYIETMVDKNTWYCHYMTLEVEKNLSIYETIPFIKALLKCRDLEG